jgi:hypothetical protein
MKKEIFGQSSALMKTMRSFLFKAVLFVVPVALMSCHARIHEIPDPDEPVRESELVPVTISVKSIEQIPFNSLMTKATVQSACTKLTYGIFSGIDDGAVKEELVVQNITDSVFGNLSLNLSVGRHYIAVVGQNGGDGNPSLAFTQPNNSYNLYSIRYSSGNKNTPKVMDTFHYFAAIDVVKGDNDYQIDLDRSVSMFRLKLTEAIPEQVCKLEFEYSNGSATLDVLNGYGCVSTKQTETFDVTPTMDTFELYTFPQRGKNVLKMNVKAYDIYGNAVAEMSWNEIPMTVNRITQYTGDLFMNGCKEFAQAGFPITVNDEWAGTDEYSLPD